MKYVKEYGFSLLKFLGFLLGGSLLLSIAYYLFIPTNIINFIAFLYMFIVFFFFGVAAGKKTENHGFLAGVKIGVLFLLVLFFLNVLFYQEGFRLYRLLYAFCLLLACVIGSTIGINTKKSKA